MLVGRRFLAGQGPAVLWVWYAGACAAAFAAGMLFMSVKSGNAPGLVGVAWQFAASVALFPLANRLIERFQDADVRFR